MKILVNGACGRMGSVLCDLLACGYRGHTAIAVDPAAAKGSSVYRSLDAVSERPDILIDFSHHSATASLCDYALRQHLPAVIATTGHTGTELSRIYRTANHLPLFFSANLSLGMALFSQLICTAAAVLPESEIEIIELHHDKKLDAPSGTAQKLAEELRSFRPEGQIVANACGHGIRPPEEIRIHSLRMGSHAGSHTVCFGSDDQTLTLTHTAHTPRLYAAGAIRAAEFLITQCPGLYGMPHLLSALNNT